MPQNTKTIFWKDLSLEGFISIITSGGKSLKVRVLFSSKYFFITGLADN